MRQHYEQTVSTMQFMRQFMDLTSQMEEQRKEEKSNRALGRMSARRTTNHRSRVSGSGRRHRK